MDKGSLDPILDRFDKIRFNKGDSSTGEVRTSMQKVMQEKNVYAGDICNIASTASYPVDRVYKNLLS